MVLLPTWMKQGGVDDWAPLLSMRRAVVVDAIATACAVCTDRELRDLDTLSQALMVEADSEVLARGTLEFIRQIFRIAKNLPAELWFNTVAEVVQADEPVRGCMFADVALVQGYFPAIVALLRARDVGHARDAARSMLEQWDAQTVAGLTHTLD